MNTNSFKDYAKYYDLIYHDKDYEAEVDFIEDIFDISHKPRKILELGCGTGNYTQFLLKKGYDVTGLDLSEKMLKRAREKCSCRFIKGDIRDFSINEKFDACICMFAVMGYMLENSDVMKAFNNIRKHLKPNGLFVFDVWNGLAVMRILPERRIKKVENDDVKITRTAVPTLRSFDHLTEVYYKIIIVDKKKNTSTEINEKHTLRFFFPQEIRYYLDCASFDIIKICPFMNLNGDVNEDVWNMMIVAQVKDS